jgi:HPt (histidine-containing phosphotransfer) domain-containing protein
MPDSIAAIKAHLKDEFGLDDSDVVEMIQDYLKNLARLLGETEGAPDGAALKRIGHSIKGLAANMGSPEIAALGKSIEDSAKPESTREQYREVLTSIGEMYEKLKAQNEAG